MLVRNWWCKKNGRKISAVLAVIVTLLKTELVSGILYPDMVLKENEYMESIYSELPIEEAGLRLGRMERLKGVAKPLCQWYLKEHRDLPWRREVTPYKVWVSEIMLQQTRVEAVKPYFARFLEALPDMEALADAPEELLLKLWEGLGYYSRVRNMQAAAKQCMEQYEGELPKEYEQLLTLKGIGTYTAGAIASIAYGKAVPAVDGNVLRVAARVTGDGEDIGLPKKKKQVEEEMRQVMEAEQIAPGVFNQALMELGAMVCLPNGAPKCDSCPLHGLCLARMRQCTDTIPYKAPKKPRRIEERTVFLIQAESRYLIRKRPGKGLLAGMYEFPAAEGYLSQEEAIEWLQEIAGGSVLSEGAADTDAAGVEIVDIEALGAARHIFTHIQWEMEGYRIVLSRKVENADGLWVTAQELEAQYSLPSAFRAYKEKLNKDILNA